jgi:hypothetical protein
LIAQLPFAGTIRLSIDWTIEETQHLLVASLCIGARHAALLAGLRAGRLEGLGSYWLRNKSVFEQQMRKARSRRRARSECSLIRVVVELIVKDQSGWDGFDPTAKLNLMAVL